MHSHTSAQAHGKAELQEAKTALTSTLHKCEKIQIGKKLGASQQTLLDRRVRALRLALSLIEEELRRIQREEGADQPVDP